MKCGMFRDSIWRKQSADSSGASRYRLKLPSPLPALRRQARLSPPNVRRAFRPGMLICIRVMFAGKRSYEGAQLIINQRYTMKCCQPYRSIRASHILIKDSGEAVLSGFRHMSTLPENQNQMTVPDVMTDMSLYIYWISPEMQDQREFGLNSDLYSVGITICELGNGVVPYSDVSPSGILAEKLEGPGPKLWDKHFLPSQEASGTTPARFEDDAPPRILRSSINYPYRRKSFSPEIENFVAVCTVTTPAMRISINEAANFKFYKLHAKDSPAATLRHLKDIGPPMRYKTTSEATGQ